MMRILNFGSLNIDYVYSVDHMVREGETLASGGMTVNPGGKGLNQSIALSRAGAKVCHAGLIGEDGGFLKKLLRQNGVDVSRVRDCPGKNGHAIIQVDRQSGRNCILLYGGSNQSMTKAFAAEALEGFGAEDMLLLQNEINELDAIIDLAYAKGMRIVLNPSPYNDRIERCDLSKVSCFLINEVEGAQISGGREDPEEILDAIRAKYPVAEVVLTLGDRGAVYMREGERVKQRAYRVPAVDTTAAGDTFTGYFLTAMAEGRRADEAMDLASRASAISVMRRGAAPSIPTRTEVESYGLEQEEKA